MKKYLLLLLFLYANLLFAQPTSEFIGLKDSIQSIIDDSNVGAQIAIFSKDKILWQENFGLADRAANIPVTDTTYFRIGSISKMFVAVAALQLIEQGKLSLNDQLIDLAPEIAFKNKWKATHPIQIKHLLEHTTGFDDLHLVEYATQAEGWTLKEGLDFHPDSRYARWQPGLFPSYCNAGPPIVAYIIEKITGQDFELYVAEHIFRPLGMQHSSFIKTPFLEKRLAKGYTPEDQEAEYWHILQRPAGSINSNIQEMVLFGQMLLARGQKDSIQLLQPSSVDRMEICRTTLAGKAGLTDGYGLHNYTTNYKGITFHGHNGGMAGYLAELQYNADLDIGFINLVNSTGAALGKINHQLFKALYQQAQSRVTNPPVTATFNDDFLGYYRPATIRSQIMHFIAPIFDILQIGKDEEGYFLSPVLSSDKERCIVRTLNTLTITNEQGYQSPFYFGEQEGKVYAQYINQFQNLEKVSPATAFLPLTITVLFLLFLLFLALYSLVWIFQKALKNPPKGQWSLRLFPLLSFGGFMGSITAIIVGGMDDAIKNFGTATPPSIGLFISTLIMGIGLLLFCWFTVKTEEGIEKPWFRVLSMVASLVFIVAFLYLYKEGIIGLRTWVY